MSHDFKIKMKITIRHVFMYNAGNFKSKSFYFDSLRLVKTDT